ncbi:MAG: DUF294 nucleotidyltransferase-like domain-containing protein [Alphaproteobacteria bacterium]
MAPDPLQRLDSYPYRHRVAEAMSRPLVTAAEDETVAAVARRMVERSVSSVVVLDRAGRPHGIATERDILRFFAAQDRPDASPVRDVMSAPVAVVDAGAFVYVALGRMGRLGIRHLVAVDTDGRAVGMITGRALLALRSADTVQIGDRIAAASTVAELGAARAELPSLCRRLLAEAVSAVDIAAVISGVYVDITARAAALVEAELADDPGFGPAPASWCLLMLGSGGRGESMLAPDQDNAILHSGNTGDDPWYAEAGRRIADRLNAAGIPYCKGGVMAMNAAWRGGLTDWEARLRDWSRTAEPDALLAVDIFYDFAPVFGDAALARRLRSFATGIAADSPEFLRRLGLALQSQKPPLGLFGQFVKRDGRIDLKMGGLLPLVAGARLLALRHRIAATDTGGRLSALRHVAAGEDERESLADAQELLMRAVLEQQLADLERGVAPSSKVDPARWSRRRATAMKAALRAVGGLRVLVADALSASAAPARD